MLPSRALEKKTNCFADYSYPKYYTNKNFNINMIVTMPMVAKILLKDNLFEIFAQHENKVLVYNLLFYLASLLLQANSCTFSLTPKSAKNQNSRKSKISFF